MMIKAHDTIVAHIAVRCSQRPENVARIAEFEFIKEWRMRLTHHQIVDSINTTHFRILVRKIAPSDVDPGASR